MALSGELEFEVEIKNQGSFFFEIYGTNKENLPKFCSNIVPRIDLLEGEWGKVGCVIMVYYNIDGKEMISKEFVEGVDEENKSITYTLLEGDLMKLYKKLRFTFQIVSKNNEAEFVKTKIEYEKMNEDVPYPSVLKDFVTSVTKTIDANYSSHIVSNHS